MFNCIPNIFLKIIFTQDALQLKTTQNLAFELIEIILSNSAEWKAMKPRASHAGNSFIFHPVFWKKVAQSDSVHTEKRMLEKNDIK